LYYRHAPKTCHNIAGEALDALLLARGLTDMGTPHLPNHRIGQVWLLRWYRIPPHHQGEHIGGCPPWATVDALLEQLVKWAAVLM
jgi:hypothetical protein